MIYGKRDERGRIVANVELRVWQTPDGRWVLRTATVDDEGRKHSGFIAGADASGWPFETDAEVALRQLVGGLLNNEASELVRKAGG